MKPLEPLLPGETRSEYLARVDLKAQLHPDTQQLVIDFCAALAQKLRAAEVKYGRGNDWLTQDWEGACRDEMHKHIDKGDPLDVAAYLAFMWRRGWTTDGWVHTYKYEMDRARAVAKRQPADDMVRCPACDGERVGKNWPEDRSPDRDCEYCDGVGGVSEDRFNAYHDRFKG
jgi:hypothetical protein